MSTSDLETTSQLPLKELPDLIRQWSQELGFQETGFSDIDLKLEEEQFLQWLAKGFHGDMDYMERHGTKRSRPAELHPGTVSVISVRMDYLPPNTKDSWEVIHDRDASFISRYALGRDYHKVMRQRLQKLAKKIQEHIGPFGHRVFVDSAPVLEKALARKSGLGWVGKHSNILSRDAGSWFFLGELFVDFELPTSTPVSDHCGRCTACIDICPTQAIVEPYIVDARRCISYLTIELKDSIPEELRTSIGNRIYGCDDCQLICPWNRFAQLSDLSDYEARHSLDNVSLAELSDWNEATFLERFQGSPIRRIGFERWQRNLAVGLGNASSSPETVRALNLLAQSESPLVKEHAQWALEQHEHSDHPLITKPVDDTENLKTS